MSRPFSLILPPFFLHPVSSPFCRQDLRATINGGRLRRRPNEGERERGDFVASCVNNLP